VGRCIEKTIPNTVKEQFSKSFIWLADTIEGISIENIGDFFPNCGSLVPILVKQSDITAYESTTVVHPLRRAGLWVGGIKNKKANRVRVPVWLKQSHFGMSELIIYEARHEGEYTEEHRETGGRCVHPTDVAAHMG